MRRHLGYDRGFTLIEVIVTIMIAAVVGVVVYQYIGPSLVRSSEPIFRLQGALALKQVAENISADYKKNYKKNLPDLKTKIHDGSNQPELVGYGDYSVVENKYITFENNQETTPSDPNEQRMLKVTIRNDQNETITMLFIDESGGD